MKARFTANFQVPVATGFEKKKIFTNINGSYS